MHVKNELVLIYDIDLAVYVFFYLYMYECFFLSFYEERVDLPASLEWASYNSYLADYVFSYLYVSARLRVTNLIDLLIFTSFYRFFNWEFKC